MISKAEFEKLKAGRTVLLRGGKHAVIRKFGTIGVGKNKRRFFVGEVVADEKDIKEIEPK